jgi:extradiol dioxygenase family protein
MASLMVRVVPAWQRRDHHRQDGQAFPKPFGKRYVVLMSLRPFHLAFPVDDLAAARAFYGGTLGCAEGRSADSWIDFDLYGHQIVAHLDPARISMDTMSNPVDGHDVPVPHFGVVLGWEEWHALAARLETAGTMFGIEPHIRFVGQPGEQATMFFRDPSGNALEFKAFKDPAKLFATT